MDNQIVTIQNVTYGSGLSLPFEILGNSGSSKIGVRRWFAVAAHFGSKKHARKTVSPFILNIFKVAA